MINKSATLIGTVEFKNGNVNSLYLGINSNTGETIIWQQVVGRRASRITGRNIAKFLQELDFVLNEGEAEWIGQPNDAALASLKSYL